MATLNRKQVDVIFDCRYSFAEAVSGTAAPPEVIRQLCLLDVRYYSFDEKLHQGQVVIHQRLEGEIKAIFGRIKEFRFPIAKAIPIACYDWADEASMADNNTSSFNYRFVAGTNRLSRHATGEAVDINPFQNPVIYEDGSSLPVGAAYILGAKGVLDSSSDVLKEFLSLGWKWGGNFSSFKDYHHFEKP